jgi:hypothetical protein
MAEYSEKDDGVKEELSESKGEQRREEHSGKESSTEHVIPEEFQHEVIKLLDEYKDSKDCLAFVRNKVYDFEEELRKKERESEMKKHKGKKVPSEYSTEAMPM